MRDHDAIPSAQANCQVELSDLLMIDSELEHSWLSLPSKLRWKLFRQFHTVQSLSDQCSTMSEEELAARLNFQWTEVVRLESAQAVKLLLRNRQAIECEMVTLLPDLVPGARKNPRATACISSQPGCGVGCTFCATGRLGFRGNFSAGEIVEQVYWAGVHAATQQRLLRNVVFMGMGEPLHNTAQVLAAIGMLTDPRLFGMAQRRITVSTVGVPRSMMQLVKLFPEVRLALSLHAVDPALRKSLVPRAIHNSEILKQAVQQVNQLQQVGVWIEVVLLAGVNDSLQHAQQLIEFCEGLRVEVNLIAYNSTAVQQQFRSTKREQRELFAAKLREAGIRTTLRNSLGASSEAACGQLHAGQLHARSVARQN